MIQNNNKLVSCLVDLGLSEREARVYIALLNRRCATATELQKFSGVPQSKVYEIIDGLIRRGYFLERKVGRKRTFEIIDPNVTLTRAFDNLKSRLQESFKCKDEISSLYENGEQVTEPFEFIEVLRGNDNIHHRYVQLVKNTQEELLGFGRGPYACDTSDKYSEQNREEEAILDRGGIQRWIYELKKPEDKWVIDDLEPIIAKGAHVRVTTSLPIKMMIFDRRSLLVAEEEPLAQRGELIMSIIKQSTIVDAFRALFEFFWQQSVDIEQWDDIYMHKI